MPALEIALVIKVAFFYSDTTSIKLVLNLCCYEWIWILFDALVK